MSADMKRFKTNAAPEGSSCELRDSTMRMQLLGILCLLLSHVESYAVIGNDDPLDTAAMYDLFGATNGATWVNNTNWATPVSICSWYGVLNCTCAQTCRISAIELRFNNLTGTLPATIGWLDQLTSLDFYSNQITGPLPEVHSRRSCSWFHQFCDLLCFILTERFCKSDFAVLSRLFVQSVFGNNSCFDCSIDLTGVSGFHFKPLVWYHPTRNGQYVSYFYHVCHWKQSTEWVLNFVWLLVHFFD
jgi:hypothetical protein